MKNTYKIVVARYNENVEWLTPEMENCLIYNKGEKMNLVNEIISENVGRESESYLKYIISNYDFLPDVVIFTQARISDHIDGGTDEISYLTRMRNEAILHGKSQTYLTYQQPQTQTLHCCWDREWNIYDGEYFLKNHYKNNTPILFIDWFKEHINPHYPNPINIYRAGLFAVKREIIISKEKSYYERLMKEVDHHINPTEGHFFERSWFYIFD